MDIKDWTTHLESTFKEDIFTYLTQFINAEENYQKNLSNRIRGYNILMNSFFSFFYKTLIISRDRQERSIKEHEFYYPFILSEFSTSFNVFRAVDILLYNGYPLNGFCLLRDLKDRAVTIAAIIHGITSYPKVKGYNILESIREYSNREKEKKLTNLRKKEEKRIFSHMMGEKSGLDATTIDLLREWQEFFNWEVHGSRLTNALQHPIKEQKMYFNFGPTLHNSSIAMCINRTTEISWMFLRTLPYLQRKKEGFGEDWIKKWLILDESFRLMEMDLVKNRKAVANAIISMIDNMFNFHPDKRYYEKQSDS